METCFNLVLSVLGMVGGCLGIAAFVYTVKNIWRARSEEETTHSKTKIVVHDFMCTETAVTCRLVVQAGKIEARQWVTLRPPINNKDITWILTACVMGRQLGGEERPQGTATVYWNDFAVAQFDLRSEPDILLSLSYRNRLPDHCPFVVCSVVLDKTCDVDVVVPLTLHLRRRLKVFHRVEQSVPANVPVKTVEVEV